MRIELPAVAFFLPQEALAPLGIVLGVIAYFSMVGIVWAIQYRAGGPATHQDTWMGRGWTSVLWPVLGPCVFLFCLVSGRWGNE